MPSISNCGCATMLPTSVWRWSRIFGPRSVSRSAGLLRPPVSPWTTRVVPCCRRVVLALAERVGQVPLDTAREPPRELKRHALVGRIADRLRAEDRVESRVDARCGVDDGVVDRTAIGQRADRVDQVDVTDDRKVVATRVAEPRRRPSSSRRRRAPAARCSATSARSGSPGSTVHAVFEAAAVPARQHGRERRRAGLRRLQRRAAARRRPVADNGLFVDGVDRLVVHQAGCCRVERYGDRRRASRRSRRAAAQLFVSDANSREARERAEPCCRRAAVYTSYRSPYSSFTFYVTRQSSCTKNAYIDVVYS